MAACIFLFKIFYEKNKDKDIVVTDVRFLDELNAIRSFGGKIVKINRDNLDFDGHSSEKDIDNYNPDLILFGHADMVSTETIQKIKKLFW